MKKRNTFKKFGALTSALVVVAGMSATSLAADMNNEGGVVGEFTQPDTPTVIEDKAIKLKKEITAFNPDACSVNAPTITYTYSVAAGTAGIDIYDVATAHNPNANVHVKTKAGVGTPVITTSFDGTTYSEGNSLVFTPSVQLNASGNGTKNDFDIMIDFSGINFNITGSGAGVYRYVISETSDNKAAAGILDGGITATRYLDVYVDGSGAIYGFVCFTTENSSIDARSGDANNVAAAGKTEGFVGVDKNGDGDYLDEGETTADSYYTFNFTLSKTVVNDAYAASTRHQFPFTVTLENESVTANVLPIMTVSENADQAALDPARIAGTWNPTIADGASISYVGIPCGTTVTIAETNDVTGVTYATSILGADANGATKNIATTESSNNAVINCGATALQKATENHAVVFTNTLLQISPTGYVVRFAPYMLLMGLGAIVLAVFKRFRTSEDED